MSGNVSGSWGEKSFFGDSSFHNGEPNKTNKEFSKNSSNPEKIYEKLNNEIKKVTENGNNSSYYSSNSNSKIERPQTNEKLFDSKIWNSNYEENKNNNQQNPIQFTGIYEKLKKKNNKKIKNKIPFPIKKKENQIFEKFSDDDFDAEIMDENLNENNEIKKIPCIQTQQNNLNYNNSTVDSSTVKLDNKFICVTEPEEYSFSQFSPLQNVNINQQEIFQNLFLRYGQIGSFVSNNYPKLGKGSFISNFNNGNKDNFINIDNNNNIQNDRLFDINKGIDNGIGNIQNYFNTEYKARILNNEIFDSKFSNLHNININSISYSQNPNLNTVKDINNQKMNNLNNEKSNSIEKINNNKTNKSNNPINNNSNKSNLKNSKNENLKGEKQLINLDDIINGKDTRTTVMIRNIPIRYTDKMLINELEEFKNKFDCIYLPYDYEKKGNKGYGFINFIHPYHILLFHEKFQHKTWTYFESKKICELNAANFQGRSDIEKHAKNYKGTKKPIFFNEIDTSKISIEVPIKYFKKVKAKYPKMIYNEKKNFGIFIIKSFE